MKNKQKIDIDKFSVHLFMKVVIPQKIIKPIYINKKEFIN